MSLNSEALRKASERKKLLWKLFHHDIINKLIVGKGYIEFALSSQESSRHLPIIKKAIDDMGKIIKNYDDFFEIDIEREITIDQALKEAREMVGKKLDIDYTKESDIQVDPLFVAIFYNLLQNSIIHSGQEKLAITIMVFSKKIIFSDNGKGIEQKQKQRIFARKEHALTTIREIGQELGFSIKETGELGQGVRFEIEFTS